MHLAQHPRQHLLSLNQAERIYLFLRFSVVKLVQQCQSRQTISPSPQWGIASGVVDLGHWSTGIRG